jgi:von Willebrand factor type A domain
MVALFGVSFLTPLDALFALAVAGPLAALLARELQATRIRRLLGVSGPPRPTVAAEAMALLLLVGLVAVGAAQPIVLREELVNERGDAQAFFIFDTSLSMDASAGPTNPTRLARAKRLALKLQAALPDVPIGVASMTDRTLIHLLPTTDTSLFTRTVVQSIGIDQPPPSEIYAGRATTFGALLPLAQNNFFAHAIKHRLAVVFTDGEAQPSSQGLLAGLRGRLGLILVHIWAPHERIYDRNGGELPDPRYEPDPRSAAALHEVAAITGGHAFDETQIGQIAGAARAAVGHAHAQTRIRAYTRVALAPWFILAGVLPLGFLLWRHNL